jgi:hypothetical protein
MDLSRLLDRQRPEQHGVIGADAGLEFLCGFIDVRVDFGTQFPLTSSVAGKEAEKTR